eukprot:jgi/Bigna1/71703/fgenesh1_pg.16_\
MARPLSQQLPVLLGGLCIMAMAGTAALQTVAIMSLERRKKSMNNVLSGRRRRGDSCKATLHPQPTETTTQNRRWSSRIMRRRKYGVKPFHQRCVSANGKNNIEDEEEWLQEDQREPAMLKEWREECENITNSRSAKERLERLNEEPVEVHIENLLDPFIEGGKVFEAKGPDLIQEIEQNTKYEASNQAGTVEYSVDGTLAPLSVKIHPELLKGSIEKLNSEILEAYVKVCEEGEAKSYSKLSELLEEMDELQMPGGRFDG